jgi:hypothetical protein
MIDLTGLLESNAHYLRYLYVWGILEETFTGENLHRFSLASFWLGNKITQLSQCTTQLLGRIGKRNSGAQMLSSNSNPGINNYPYLSQSSSNTPSRLCSVSRAALSLLLGVPASIVPISTEKYFQQRMSHFSNECIKGTRVAQRAFPNSHSEFQNTDYIRSRNPAFPQMSFCASTSSLLLCSQMRICAF